MFITLVGFGIFTYFCPPLNSSARHSEQEILRGLLHHRHVLLSRSQHTQYFLLCWDNSNCYQVSLDGCKDTIQYRFSAFSLPLINESSWWSRVDTPQAGSIITHNLPPNCHLCVDCHNFMRNICVCSQTILGISNKGKVKWLLMLAEKNLDWWIPKKCI